MHNPFSSCSTNFFHARWCSIFHHRSSNPNGTHSMDLYVECHPCEHNHHDFDRFTSARGSHLLLIHTGGNFGVALEHISTTIIAIWLQRKSPLFRQQDQSRITSEEGAVLGQLRGQRPSSNLFKGSLCWIWLEEVERKAKSASVHYERIIAKVHMHPVSQQFFEEAESGIASLH